MSEQPSEQLEGQTSIDEVTVVEQHTAGEAQTVYTDDQGADAAGMSGPAHSDDGTNPGDEGGSEGGEQA